MAERRVVQDLNTPKHYNPIPTCVTLGNLILPSVMGAYDPKLPPEQQGPEVQIEKSVANMKNIIVSAGGNAEKHRQGHSLHQRLQTPGSNQSRVAQNVS